MPIVKKINLKNLTNFLNDNSYLNIVERTKPHNSDMFFEELLTEHLTINRIINKKSILSDIKGLLNEFIPKKIKKNNFYNIWVKDMAEISKIFCSTTKEDYFNFTLETSRTCRRFHIDNVPIRLLVTYCGRGTEWIPSHASDYSAYYNGEKNEKIIIDQTERKFISPWNIAVFKGQKFKDGENGILHRTPYEALNKISLLMRLDNNEIFQ